MMVGDGGGDNGADGANDVGIDDDSHNGHGDDDNGSDSSDITICVYSFFVPINISV